MMEVVKVSLFLSVFGVMILINYRVLNALDFSKLFKPNSTGQIKIILIVLSISLAFLVAFSIYQMINLVEGMFV